MAENYPMSDRYAAARRRIASAIVDIIDRAQERRQLRLLAGRLAA